jgi:hypothetical protein
MMNIASGLKFLSLKGTGGAQDLHTHKNFCQENLTEVGRDEDFIHNLWISPYFLEHDNGRIITVISGCYANILTTFLTDELATGFPEVKEAFHNCIISRNGDIPWHPRLPNLSTCYFFMRPLKSKL